MADGPDGGQPRRGGRRAGAGRPRDPAVDAAILAATTAVLRTVGLRGLTVELVAAEAGVSPGSVYRRWPSKKALLAGAFREVLGPPDPADTGSLRGDLLALVDDSVRFFTGDHGKLLAALHAAAEGDEDLGRAVRVTARHRRSGLRAIVERAVDRGEVDAGVDVDLAIDLFTGPLWTRLLVTGQRISRPYVARLAEAVATALGA